MRTTATILVLGVICLPCAHASLVSTTTFSGTKSEGFETFDNWFPGPFINYLLDPTPIMGGFAQLTGSRNVVYEPASAATFSLGDKGPAQVASGRKGLGLNADNGNATIIFRDPVDAFGGFYNVTSSANNRDNTLTFTFFSESGAVIDSPQVAEFPMDNAMYWLGWRSSTPIKSVRVFGHYGVMDDLQVQVVPEPASIALLGAGLAAVAARRRRAK